MFISGVGGTGKSFLIKTICAQVCETWHDKRESLLCAVTALTGLAAFNVGEITIHRLLQLPIEHEGKTLLWYKYTCIYIHMYMCTCRIEMTVCSEGYSRFA